MVIQVRNEEEFANLIKEMANELVSANIAFQMYRDLKNATGEYHREMNEANGFWHQTMDAHLDAAIFRLCKIYDQKHLGLREFLLTVQNYPHFFRLQSFAGRVPNLTPAQAQAAFTPLNPAQLDADLGLVSRGTNPAVEKLLRVRNNFYSHRNAQNAAQGITAGQAYPITLGDIEQLLETGMDVLNRYSSHFMLQTYARKMIGQRDFEYVLKDVRARLVAHRREMDASLRGAGIDPDQEP